MNAADLVAEIESRFGCVQGVHRALCQTLEPYVSLGFEDTRRNSPYKALPVPGTLRDGEPRLPYDSEEAACAAALYAFGLYARWWRYDHGDEAVPILYWRYDPPHAFWHDRETVNGRGFLKLRLVLSDRPVVWQDDASYDALRTAQIEREFFPEDYHGHQR